MGTRSSHEKENNVLRNDFFIQRFINKAVFTCGFRVKSNSCLLQFCITTLSDWLKNFAALSQPIRRIPKLIMTLSRTFLRAS